MKQLKCEICGSAGLIKENGLYTCKMCGAKFSLDEVKKMIGDIPSADNIIDNFSVRESEYKRPSNLNKQYAYAQVVKCGHTTYDAGVLGPKQKFIPGCDEVGHIGCEIEFDNLNNDSSVKYASIYVTPYNEVGDIVYCTVTHLSTKGVQITGPIASTEKYTGYFEGAWYNNTIKKAVIDHIEVEYMNGEKILILPEDFERGAEEKIVIRATKNQSSGLITSLSDVSIIFFSDRMLFAGSNIYYKDITGVKLTSFIDTKLLQVEEGKSKKSIIYGDNDADRINQICDRIRQFIKREKPESNFEVTKKNGCYVATCVYGSYDCPEVWTLRRYRDNTLGSTWYGRAFIRTYYAVSPTLVKFFGHTKWFKKMWKRRLDRMVKKLQDKGVENTPYEDKDWRK